MWWGAAAWLLAGAASADPGGTHFEIDGEFGSVIFVGSAYRDSLRDFGQKGPSVGFQTALRALFGHDGVARMGLRAGYLWTSAWSAATLPDSSLGAASAGNVSFHIMDLGWTLRWLPWRPDRQGVTGRYVGAGFDLEAGPAVVVTSWTRGTGANLVLRAAVSFVFGSMSDGVVRVAGRVGFQYVPSGGASGGAWGDPAFAGVTVGLELGGGR